jgi:hypothetical protein
MNTKNEALNYSLLGVGVVAAVWLLAGLRINFEIDTAAGWATSAALLAMVPMAYRGFWKRVTGR